MKTAEIVERLQALLEAANFPTKSAARKAVEDAIDLAHELGDDADILVAKERMQ